MENDDTVTVNVKSYSKLFLSVRYVLVSSKYSWIIIFTDIQYTCIKTPFEYFMTVNNLQRLPSTGILSLVFDSVNTTCPPMS